MTAIYKCTCCDCSVWRADGVHCVHCLVGMEYVAPDESVYLPEFDVLNKAADDKHTVFGWANVSMQPDGSIPLDWDGDVMSPAVLEKAAYQFVLKHRTTGEMHQGGAVGHLIESVMFTKQKMEAMGIPVGIVPEGWWVGFHIPDEDICNKIKDGKYNMFSIHGRYRRLKV